MQLINNYHKEAEKISKYDVSAISDVQTEIGMRKGFTYGRHIIFFFDETMLVESPGIGIHELAIYEIEGL